MVRVKGLEPPWGEPHTDLNRTRLPIPPHPRVARKTSEKDDNPAHEGVQGIFSQFATYPCIPAKRTLSLRMLCGCRQVVRPQLPKLVFAGSSPVTRSKECCRRPCGACFVMLLGRERTPTWQKAGVIASFSPSHTRLAASPGWNNSAAETRSAKTASPGREIRLTGTGRPFPMGRRPSRARVNGG